MSPSRPVKDERAARRQGDERVGEANRENVWRSRPCRGDAIRPGWTRRSGPSSTSCRRLSARGGCRSGVTRAGATWGGSDRQGTRTRSYLPVLVGGFSAGRLGQPAALREGDEFEAVRDAELVADDREVVRDEAGGEISGREEVHVARDSFRIGAGAVRRACGALRLHARHVLAGYFPLFTRESAGTGPTSRLGHVNNIVFSPATASDERHIHGSSVTPPVRAG